MIRAFIAIDLSREVRDALRSLQEDLKKTRADVRWVKPEAIHLTLKFLGNITEDTVGKVAGGMGAAAREARACTIHIRGLGAFPSTARPRIVWVGVREDTGALRDLQGRIEHEMERIGVHRETRSFRPHLTLGRFTSSRGRDQIVPRLEEGADRVMGSFIADEIVLFKSTLLPSGAEYSRLNSTALAPLSSSSPVQGGEKNA